jgi:hypothetical protein
MGLLMLLCRHRVGYTDTKQRGREKRGDEKKRERKRNEVTPTTDVTFRPAVLMYICRQSWSRASGIRCQTEDWRAWGGSVWCGAETGKLGGFIHTKQEMNVDTIIIPTCQFLYQSNLRRSLPINLPYYRSSE